MSPPYSVPPVTHTHGAGSILERVVELFQHRGNIHRQHLLQRLHPGSDGTARHVITRMSNVRLLSQIIGVNGVSYALGK